MTANTKNQGVQANLDYSEEIIKKLRKKLLEKGENKFENPYFVGNNYKI